METRGLVRHDHGSLAPGWRKCQRAFGRAQRPFAGQQLLSVSRHQWPGFEELSDKSAHDIFKEVREMRSDDDNDLMAHHARGYTNAQVRDLSRYLSRQR